MLSVTAFPYWCGNWSATITPTPGAKPVSGTFDVVAQNVDPATGFVHSLIYLDYPDGKGGTINYNLWLPANENPDDSTLTGSLSTSLGAAHFSSFLLTANANASPGSVPDSFTGSIGPIGPAPLITISGVFDGVKGQPPAYETNPSLTSASDFFGDTLPRSRPLGGISFTTQPMTGVIGKSLPAIQVASPTGGAVTLTLSSNTAGATLTPQTSITVVPVKGVATFTSVAVDKAGTFTLSATVGKQTVVSHAFTVAKPVAPTLTSITGELGAQLQKSTDGHLAISAANVFAVPQSDASMTFTDSGLAPLVTNPNVIQWTIVRNSTDIAADKTIEAQKHGSEPAFTAGAQGAKVTLALHDAIGSFNVIAYFDSNANAKYDSGEEIKVFHLALVGVVVKTGGIIHATSSNFTVSDRNGLAYIGSGDFGGSHFAITEAEKVQVIGGGPSGLLGVNKIHVGWLQNGVTDTFTIKYRSGATEMERLTAGSFPILDSTYNNGGASIYGLTLGSQNPPPASPPGPTRDPLIGNDPTGGQDRGVATGDSPACSFSDTHNGSPAVSTSGVNGFIDYLSAFSDDFNASYTGYLQVNWVATFKYNRTVAGVWQNAGSTVTASVDEYATPMTLASLHAKTSGPLFNQSNRTS